MVAGLGFTVGDSSHPKYMLLSQHCYRPSCVGFAFPSHSSGSIHPVSCGCWTRHARSTRDGPRTHNPLLRSHEQLFQMVLGLVCFSTTVLIELFLDMRKSSFVLERYCAVFQEDFLKRFAKLASERFTLSDGVGANCERYDCMSATLPACALRSAVFFGTRISNK